MNTVALDTHKTIQKLVERGFTQEQAEGVVEIITENDLVTQQYLDLRLAEFEAKMYKAFLVHGLVVVLGILGGAALLLKVG